MEQTDTTTTEAKEQNHDYSHQTEKQQENEEGGGDEMEIDEEYENENEEEEEDDDEEEEEEEDDECHVNFEGELNPLDLVTNDDNINNHNINTNNDNNNNNTDTINNNNNSKSSNDQLQLYQQFERLEFQALAARNHHNNNHIHHHPRREGSIEELGLDENIGATHEEIMEVRNYGLRKRRSRREPKKKGRRKGSKNKVNPEIQWKIGEATLHYAHSRYDEGIKLLNEVVLMAPNLAEPYDMLGRIYEAMGQKKKATGCYMIAAILSPKDTPLWKRLVDWSIEQENMGQAWYCLNKAINADPSDISLRNLRASLLLEKGEYQKAADTYHHIVQICPDDFETLQKAATLYKHCGQYDRSISILEEYVEKHLSGATLPVVDMLVSACLESDKHSKALYHIERVKEVCGPEFPLNLSIREGICHARLGNMEKAEICFSALQRDNAKPPMGLTMAVGNTYMSLQQYQLGLKYYLLLEGCASNNELIHVKIAHCYSALKETALAIQFFYRALKAREGDIETRLTLASLLVEENRVEEALTLLLPPPNPGSSNDGDAGQSEPWWINVKLKFKLAQIYKSKGMLESYVEVIYPIVHESLTTDSIHLKVKQRKRLTASELSERAAKVLSDDHTDSVLLKLRPLASRNDLVKGNRAKKKLKVMETLKEQKKSAALAAGLDWESDESEDEVPRQPVKEPPLPDLFRDEEHYNLILELCTALTSLRRYKEALEIINLTLKITYKTVPVEKKEKFRALGAQIALNVTDPSDGFDYVRYIVQQRPHSIAAWNYYYRLVLRLENRLSKHSKFLLQMRQGDKSLVPPMVITGNQFTMISHHQDAAREYLEAYKHMPDSPLINLCVGTSLINLALGHRLQNKHQCVVQGMAFLYNNLRLCDNSQESLYNIARALHHVGLVHLAASYYDKVLAIRQQDYPVPQIIKEDRDHAEHPKPGYCDLRREAAYNLHLIYKQSGAVDLARQLLRDYCTM